MASRTVASTTKSLLLAWSLIVPIPSSSVRPPSRQVSLATARTRKKLSTHNSLAHPPPYTSGGGFSNIFPRPTYQEQAVKTFFKNADPGYPYYKTSNGNDIGANGGIYNRAGRGTVALLLRCKETTDSCFINRVSRRFGQWCLVARLYQ